MELRRIIIDGLYTKYKIDSLGNIYSPTKNLPMKIRLNHNGYPTVSLRLSSAKRKTMFVHRLVALRFIPNLENKPYVNHKDNNKLNNAISNLEWVTSLENNRHKVNCNRQAKGETQGSSKLTELEVLKIRKLYTDNIFSIRELAIKFSLSRSHISDIINRKYWKHI